MQIAVEARYSKEGIIEIFDGEDSFKSYATIWFDFRDEAIVAEPFGDYGSERQFYNREVDFEVVDIIK